MKKQRLARLIEPGMGSYFLVFLMFCAALLFINIYVAVVGFVIIAVMYVMYRRASAERRRAILKYIDTLGNNASAARNSVIESPFPTIILSASGGEVFWCNASFYELAGEREHIFERRISEVLPGMDTRWIRDGKIFAPEPIALGGKYFDVYATTEHSGETVGILTTLYLIDVTEELTLRTELERVRPAIGIIMLDNYDELTKNLSDTQKSTLLAEVDEKINEWLERVECFVRKYDRDRHIMVCERHVIDALMAEKFPVLDAARGIISSDIPVTLSVGIGIEGENYGELFSFASLAIDMALSRGGDQAVVKNKLNFEFFGGKTQEMERRTKVKSRVMANALRQLINSASTVFVMGHKNSDLDSVGSAAGIISACRRLGKRAHIVIDRNKTAAGILIDRLAELEEYEGVFIAPETAMVLLDPQSLLIVVDVNRPEVVESREILDSCTRIAVIDHHRRAASYIDNAALNMHEPYASSASELVCELLEYIDMKTPMLRAEADALLAGIVLDTKNFTMRTGVRTFEAAAVLRRAGADTIEMKRLFQTDYQSYVERCEIVSKAALYKGELAVVLLDRPTDRTVAAQAADELLNVLGVQASFVLFPEGNQVIISARSLGKVNVQVVLEKLGGGGHLDMAGAQMTGVTPEMALSQLYVAIDDYRRA